MRFLTCLQLHFKIYVICWYIVSQNYYPVSDTIKEKQSIVETSSPAKEIRETSSFVPDVHRSRTPENKVEKDRVSRKGKLQNMNCYSY